MTQPPGCNVRKGREANGDDLALRDSWKRQLTWCARQIKSMSCFCKNLDTTSGPNVNDTPRSFSDQPVISLSGSDHSRSHNSPA